MTALWRSWIVPVAAGLAVGLIMVVGEALYAAPVAAKAPHAHMLASRPQPAEASLQPDLRSARNLRELVIPVGRGSITLPILEYHYIRVNPNPGDRLGADLSVTPWDFAAQMSWLAKNRYHPVTFDDVRAYFAGRQPLPARPVILTFDDGYLDFFTTAEPVLRSYQFKAVAYIVPGFWGRRQYMTPAEVATLDRSGLVEIASHTVDHTDLARAPAGWRSYELSASRSMLQALLGHPVVDFCYPSGQFGDGAAGAVGAAGYSTATTEMPGTELEWSTRLVWPRVRVSGGETIGQFAASLGRPETSVIATYALTLAPVW